MKEHEHYLDPEDFDEFIDMNEDEYYALNYIVNDVESDRVKRMIQGFKEANKLASDFRYTCMCLWGSTKWVFAYPISQRKEINALLEKRHDEIYSSGLKIPVADEDECDESDDDLDAAAIVSILGESCQCPFWE